MQTLVSVGATKTMTENERLETPRQLAERVGISERKVRALIKTGRLEYVMIGARPHIPAGAFARFLERERRSTWDGETRDQVCIGATSADGQSDGRKEAATALRTAANLLALSRSFLRRADPVTSLDQRRSENRAAAGRLGEYIERWRRRIAEDGQRIVASEQAGPFYDRLVGMLLDLGGPDEAWVAAEPAKARAAADLLGIGPDEEPRRPPGGGRDARPDRRRVRRAP